MARSTGLLAFRTLAACLGAGLALACLPAAGHEPVQTIAEPGFRPPSEGLEVFIAAVGDTSIAVLPSIVRRIDRVEGTDHSLASQRQVVEFLNDSRIARATPVQKRIDPGQLEHRSQWELFRQGMSAVAEIAARDDVAADYVMVMEFIIPPGDKEVFGIEVYILDREGRNAFSFLLNSHHQLFAAAGLVSGDSSAAARDKMIEDATRTGLVALQAQIAAARECLEREAIPSARALPGVFEDFDGALPSGVDAAGVRVGYSTFNGPGSTVGFTTTDSYPPRAGVGEGNRVLRVDLNVTTWGGIVNLFANETADRWVSYDWRQLDGFSFWFLGANSGAELFFHIFDNRHLCSRTDDAERFGYRFRDDVSGWRLITARFEDLVRKDVFNNAPDDGLGLVKVHGWGLGTLGSGGPVRFYLDDFRLLQDARNAPGQ